MAEVVLPFRLSLSLLSPRFVLQGCQAGRVVELKKLLTMHFFKFAQVHLSARPSQTSQASAKVATECPTWQPLSQSAEWESVVVGCKSSPLGNPDCVLSPAGERVSLSAARVAHLATLPHSFTRRGVNYVALPLQLPAPPVAAPRRLRNRRNLPGLCLCLLLPHRLRLPIFPRPQVREGKKSPRKLSRGNKKSP